MDILHNIVLVLHFIGLASLLGGFIVHIKSFTASSDVLCCAVLCSALLILNIILVVFW